MSEFSQSHSDQRLLGAPPGYVGYEEGGQLTNLMKANPFRVLLFDEIEKAHPSILDKFLQILEDGRMTDGHGETVYFSESIIIFTSNVGTYRLDAQTCRPMLDQSGKPILTIDPAVDTEYGQLRTKLLDGVHSYFKHVLGRPELLNRIGQNIVIFDFIRKEMMARILESKILESIRTLVMELWKVDVILMPEISDQLIAMGGNDVASGARGIGNLTELALLNPLSRVLFELLCENGASTLEGQTLEIMSIVPPKENGSQRYEIEWRKKN